ncbi:MAG: response regulator transcription factor [Clostridia bacterium]|nr:response regulator transcription factor [Clostridia bacterium]
MSDIKILIADDEPAVHESLGLYLKKEGYETTDVYDGKAAVDAIAGGDISLCVLDIMMPKMSGIDVCREVRKNSRIPIIMLTARGEEIDKILGLELGADDYIVKPFSPKEVTARVRAVLRRTSEKSAENSSVVSRDGLVINLESYMVTLDGQPIVCTPKEIEILHLLVSNPGHVFTREELLSKVWGYDYAGETRTVDTHIKRIRAKLGDSPRNWEIKTIYSVGYKFDVR